MGNFLVSFTSPSALHATTVIYDFLQDFKLNSTHIKSKLQPNGIKIRILRAYTNKYLLSFCCFE